MAKTICMTVYQIRRKCASVWGSISPRVLSTVACEVGSCNVKDGDSKSVLQHVVNTYFVSRKGELVVRGQSRDVSGIASLSWLPEATVSKQYNKECGSRTTRIQVCGKPEMSERPSV